MPGGYPCTWEICNGTDQGTTAASSTGVTLTDSGTAGTYGSYSQLVASSAIDACFIGINIAAGNFPTSNNLVVKIAVGAAASEKDIVVGLMCYNGSTSAMSYSYFFPVNIPAGTRISAAAAGSGSGTADTCAVTVTLFDGSYSQIEGCAGVDAIGQATAKGTAMTAGAANTKGSYAQLIASTSKDYLGFSFAFDAGGTAILAGTSGLVDIAIGGAGSEVVIIPNYLFFNAVTNVPAPALISHIFPIPIPAGTRIAARFQDTAGSGNLSITLYGIYQ